MTTANQLNETNSYEYVECIRCIRTKCNTIWFGYPDITGIGQLEITKHYKATLSRLEGCVNKWEFSWYASKDDACNMKKCPSIIFHCTKLTPFSCSLYSGSEYPKNYRLLTAGAVRRKNVGVEIRTTQNWIFQLFFYTLYGPTVMIFFFTLSNKTKCIMFSCVYVCCTSQKRSSLEKKIQ